MDFLSVLRTEICEYISCKKQKVAKPLTSSCLSFKRSMVLSSFVGNVIVPDVSSRFPLELNASHLTLAVPKLLVRVTVISPKIQISIFIRCQRF